MSETSPISVEVSLVSTTVMLGEPVVLNCRINNSIGTIVLVYMGEDNKGWLTLSLEDDMRQPVPPKSDSCSSTPGGVHLFGARISPGSHYSRSVVVNQDFSITQPGGYELLIAARLPYAMEPEAVGVRPELLEKEFGTVFLWQKSLSLTITPTNADRLREVAKSLLENAVEARSGKLRRLSLTSLFSMPVEDVLSLWRAAVTDPRLTSQRTFMAHCLQRLNSLEAADLLADLIWNSTSDPRLKKYLNNMFFSADAALKEHIAQLFRQHNAKISVRPIRPLD